MPCKEAWLLKATEKCSSLELRVGPEVILTVAMMRMTSSEATIRDRN